MSLSALLTPVLVPPVNLAVLAALALLLGARRGAVVCLLLLLLLCLPIVGGSLLHSLDPNQPAAVAAPPAAIVVLGGDLQRDPAAPDGAEPGPLTLLRLRDGAALARRTGLPVLVTGGVVLHGAAPVAQVMADSLRQDFGVTARWVETRSATTWENAADSAPLLRAAGIRSAYVVTQAWHMRRTLIAFADTGLAVTPAPVRRDPPPQWQAADFVPEVRAWVESYYGLHEWIGCAWYRLRGHLAHD